MGIDPTLYYRDTVRNNYKRANAWEKSQEEEWQRTRFLAFTIIDYTFRGMSGEKVNKKFKSPKDLLPLPSDPKEKAVSKEETIKLLDSLTK